MFACVFLSPARTVVDIKSIAKIIVVLYQNSVTKGLKWQGALPIGIVVSQQS